MGEDFMMGTAQDQRDDDLAARQEEDAVDAWHGVMDALPVGLAADLKVAAKVLHHVGRALQAERNGEPFDYYQTALNDAAAVIRDTHVDTRPGRITRIKTLADAIEAKELAE